MLPKDIQAQLETAVAAAFAGDKRHNASMWNELYAVLMATFSLPRADVRCGLMDKKKNVTNRAQKDVAWQNPRVLALVLEQGGEVDADRAARAVTDFVAKYAQRHEDAPWLRACLIFDSTKLERVMVFYPPGESPPDVPDATVGAGVASADAGDEAKDDDAQ